MSRIPAGTNKNIKVGSQRTAAGNNVPQAPMQPSAKKLGPQPAPQKMLKPVAGANTGNNAAAPKKLGPQPAPQKMLKPPVSPPSPSAGGNSPAPKKLGPQPAPQKMLKPLVAPPRPTAGGNNFQAGVVRNPMRTKPPMMGNKG